MVYILNKVTFFYFVNILLSSIHFNNSFTTHLSCHSTGQSFVIIICSSHFQAIRIISDFSAILIADKIASFLVVIIQKPSVSFLSIQGNTSFIIFSIFSE